MGLDCCICSGQSYDLCQKCYDEGKGCDEAEEHRAGWLHIYIDDCLMSYAGFSSWVEKGKLPKDLEAEECPAA